MYCPSLYSFLPFRPGEDPIISPSYFQQLFLFLSHVLLLVSVFPSGVGFHPLYIICPSFPSGSVAACFSLFILPGVSFCSVIFFR